MKSPDALDPVTDDALDPVTDIRSFNRYYTKVIGLLDAGLADTPYSLSEARVLFELARAERTEVPELRAELGLDAGYLSRLLSRFESGGLVDRLRSADDARRQVIRLTPDGRATFELLDRRSTEEATALISRLDPGERRRLVAAMGTIRELLSGRPRPGSYLIRPPEPGDLGWVVQRHGALYAQEYGFDASFETLVARIVADFAELCDPKSSAAWIAEVDGSPAGCVFCVPDDERTAKLRLLLVEPTARGLGIGARLVDACLRFARRAGYPRITLWTNDILTSARRIYQAAGFELVDSEPHHSFGHDLVGQNWARDL